jgi:hypothetical protein
VEDAPGREELVEAREVVGRRPVRQLGLLLGVEVVEVAEELVEAMDRGQELVPVAEVVLAELPGGVAQRLERSAIVGSSGCRPMSAPGMPTLLSPVR